MKPFVAQTLVSAAPRLISALGPERFTPRLSPVSIVCHRFPYQRQRAAGFAGTALGRRRRLSLSVVIPSVGLPFMNREPLREFEPP
jgi:hypothetical protein